MPLQGIGLLFALLLFSVPTLHAQCDPAGFPAHFGDVMSGARERVTKGELPSLTVALAKDGHIVCEQAFGFADLTKRVPATSRTMYAAGSVAKSVTATAAFLLASRGKLDLDAAAAHYGVEIRTLAGPMTIRQLLNMTAGVPHGWFYSYGPSADRNRVLQRYAVGAFQPGKHFSYSNFSYGVVGEVVEHAAREPYPQLIEKEVLRPLNMTASGFTPPADASIGYSEGKAAPVHTFEPQAGGGFYTSAHDLATFGLFQLSSAQTLISSSLMKSMHTPPADANVLSRYNAGWGILKLGDATVLLSNGRVLAGSATLLLIPEKRLAISCLTNTSSDATDEIAFQLADVFSPGLLFGFDMLRKEAAAAESPQSLSTQPSLRGRWRGELRLPDGKKVPVSMDVEDAGTVVITVGAKKSVVKNPRLEAGFVVGEADISIDLPEARNQASTTELQLELPVDGRLTGILRAVSKGDLPYFGLPVLVSMRKTNQEPMSERR